MTGIAVMGCGVVGYGVVEMLIENAEQVKRICGCEVKPVYMLDIRDIPTPEGVKLVHNFDEILTDEVQIVVETIGGNRIAYEFTKKALMSGRHVVTSNKELVATKGDELKKIAAEHNVYYMYEASVGGGIPVLHPIMRCLQGNKLFGVDGIVNGSTNYLLTQMKEKGISFDEALVTAKQLGYVEADPAADVDGWDARRKLAILANSCFGSKLADEGVIPTTGIRNVKREDIEQAEKLGGAIKLIAHAKLSADGKKWSGWVSPCFVKKDCPLYGVVDVFNGIIVHGNYVGDTMFYGRGAGRKATASAVVGDIIEIARGGYIKETPFASVPEFCEDTASKLYFNIYEDKAEISEKKDENAKAVYPVLETEE